MKPFVPKPFAASARWPLAAMVALSAFTWAASANAYCQTTTCDPTVSCGDDPEQCCVLNDSGCDVNGMVIRWPSSCVSYSVQVDGSPKLGIDGETAAAVVNGAFSTWMQTRCDGQPASLVADDYGPVLCDRPVYNDDEGSANANVWMFSDEQWEYSEAPGSSNTVATSALAITLISFNWETAEVYDADVIFNSAHVEFTTGDDVNIDLASIATHEAGHFLGLDHSSEPFSTMSPGYVPGSVSPRSLSEDDIAGLCASYPPGRPVETDSCDPRGGFSIECEGGGCSYAGPTGRSGTPIALLALALAGLWAWRRRTPLPG